MLKQHSCFVQFCYVICSICRRSVLIVFLDVVLLFCCYAGDLLFCFSVIFLSGGIRVGILQKLDVVAFSSWNLNVMAFCPLKKCFGITMLGLNCLHFLISWCFSPWISMSQCFGLEISMSCCFGISMSWYMSLHGLVSVS